MLAETVHDFKRLNCTYLVAKNYILDVQRKLC